MSSDPAHYDRRRFVQLAGLAGLLAASPLSLTTGSAAAAAPAHPGGHPADPVDQDSIAATYYQALLTHTRWAETQWDDALGHYTAKDFGFAVVLGHAVLLTHGTYDAERAGDRQGRPSVAHWPPSSTSPRPTASRAERNGAGNCSSTPPSSCTSCSRPACSGTNWTPPPGRTSRRSPRNRRSTRQPWVPRPTPLPGVDGQRAQGRLRRRHEAGGDGRLRPVTGTRPRLVVR